MSREASEIKAYSIGEESPLLGGGEREQLLVEWNQTTREYQGGQCIHQLFEQQTERDPGAMALRCGDREMSYGELNRRANGLAHYLRRMGIGPEHLVGICLDRSLEMVVGLIGILKAGAAYLPIDPAYPRQRIDYMTRDAGVQVIVAQQRMGEFFSAPEIRMIYLDASREEIGKENTSNLLHDTDVDNIAYVIYTSGSTGMPKGAMNTHRGISNRLLWMQEAYQLTKQDKVLQKTPYSFDVSVWEFFWPLMVGAQLVIARPGGHQDSSYLVNLIAEEQITTIHFVPSMLQVFLEQKNVGRCNSLKRVVCSGETLSYELQENFFKHLDAKLYNLYGPTEAAVDVTHWECEHTPSQAPVPIGRPIANTQIFILDANLQIVSLGVAGELYIGGGGVGRGYWKRPDLTAERFLPNPFSDPPGARLYKTGDLARYRQDGNIEYLGRTDYQIKLRGFRIEAGEIESALRLHPAVRDAIVVLRTDESGDSRLVVYLAIHQKQPVEISELRTFTSERLPDYMVPSLFVTLDDFPLTPNGKVNRQALPLPGPARPSLDSLFIPPRGLVEESVAKIWSDVLQIEPIGINDNFFELGGHSLLMTQVTSRIREKFKVDLQLQAFFQGPTIANLSVAITKLQASHVSADDINQILDQLAQLSEEDVRRLLEERHAVRSEADRQNTNYTDPAPISTSARPSLAAAEIDLCYCADVESFSVGNGLYMVCSKEMQTTRIVSVKDAELLRQCRSFKTIDEHARDRHRDARWATESLPSIHNQLSEFIQAGFLVSSNDVVDDLAQSVSSEKDHVKISSICIATRDRLAALNRGLISYIENGQTHGRSAEFIITDDSVNAENRDACKQMLRSLKSRYGVDIAYAGLEEKILFAKKLIDGCGFQPDMVKFALFGMKEGGLITHGANRNSLLLHTAGDAILSVDDDTVCRIGINPEREGALDLVSGKYFVETEQTPIWAFKELQDAIGFTTFVETDVLAIHEEVLGREVAQIISSMDPSKIILKNADTDFIRNVKTGKGRVVVTLNGVLGDCGWGSPTFYLFFKGSSLERLTRSEAEYRTACTSRNILQAAKNLTITDKVNMGAGFFGLDNRNFMPPFMPVGRGEDTIYGIMVSKCFSDYNFAHLPYTLLHMPIETRAFWPGEVARSASGIDVSSILMALINSFDPGSFRMDARGNLVNLGKYLEQIGNMKSGDFRKFARGKVWEHVETYISTLEKRLKTYGESAKYWARDIERYINIQQQSITRERYYLPLELSLIDDIDHAQKITQSLIFEYGRLLRVWLDMVEAARELKVRDERLATTL